jgi:tripartite-type tricarboxylate transporter receptor subunit TctC
MFMQRASFVALGLVLGCWTLPGHAQSAFPQKDITFIVPWNAGGSNDVAMRALDPLLREHGIKVVIENVPGATGVIGMKRVASAAPDGYVIGMGTSSTLALIAQNKANGLSNSNFTHIARVSTDPLMLLVPSASPIKTLPDFIANMKAKPGKVSIGTPGSYNLNYVNVPYTGGAKVVGDLIGQHVDSGVLKPSETLGQIQENLLKPIGIFADERLEMFPDAPTFKEKGIDVFPYGPVVQMAYVVGPANLPDDVRNRLTTAFRSAIQDPRFKEFAKRNVFLVDDMTGDALAKEVDNVASAIGKVAAQTFPKE